MTESFARVIPGVTASSRLCYRLDSSVIGLLPRVFHIFRGLKALNRSRAGYHKAALYGYSGDNLRQPLGSP